MLPKEKRLKRADFSRFFASGRRIPHPLFMIVYSEYPTFHASVVVPKKAAPKAVVRNRVRRRIYELLRHTPGIFIVLANKKSISATREELGEALQVIIGRIGNKKVK